MARYNTPIWQDKSVLTNAHVYILKDGQWVDTGRHFTALPGQTIPNYLINRIAEDYVKSKAPTFNIMSLYSAYTETQPDAYQVLKTDYNNTEYGMYNDWSYEIRTDTGHCQNAPVNRHADARQILTYGRWGVSGDSIIVKELILPDIKMQPNSITIGAEQYQTITIVVTSNIYFELILPEWLTASQTAFTSGTTVAYLYPQTNTSFDRRDFDILAKHESYWSTDYEYTSLAHVTQSGKVAYLNVTPDPLGIPYSSGSTYVAVYTNTDFTATTNSSDTWFTYSGKTEVGVNYYNVYFNVSANTGDNRQTHAYFEYVVNSSGGTQTRAIRVAQAHAPYITIIPSGKTIDAGIQTIEIEVNSEAPWQVASAPAWVSAPSSGTSGTTLISVSVDSNASASTRNGSIVFSNGPRQVSFSILQEIPLGSIKYTSTDNNAIVPPYTSDYCFGVNYVTSVYYPEHGVGYIILADDPIMINNSTFYEKETLESIEIPDSVTSIGQSAFAYCTNLENIIIGSGVTLIRDYAFEMAYAITSLTFNGTILEWLAIEKQRFWIDQWYYSHNNIEVNCVDGDISIEYDQWSLLYTSTDGNIVALNNNAGWGTNYVEVIQNTYENDGFGVVWFDRDRDRATSISNAFSGNTRLATVYYLPSTITSIGEGAFLDCTALSGITLPSGVTTIGYNAFNGCTALSAITLHEGITTLSGGCFCGCTSLSSVTIPSTVTILSRGSDSTGAFQLCSALSSVTISEGVPTIGEQCFSHCEALLGITIPSSVTTIGRAAFSGCTALSSISYNGTMSQWVDVSKGNYWHRHCPATVVHCTDGDVPL